MKLGSKDLDGWYYVYMIDGSERKHLVGCFKELSFENVEEFMASGGYGDVVSYLIDSQFTPKISVLTRAVGYDYQFIIYRAN